LNEYLGHRLFIPGAMGCCRTCHRIEREREREREREGYKGYNCDIGLDVCKGFATINRD